MSTGEVQPLSLELPLESEDRRISSLQKREGKIKKKGIVANAAVDKCSAGRE